MQNQKVISVGSGSYLFTVALYSFIKTLALFRELASSSELASVD
jgi:hypothetical protein